VCISLIFRSCTVVYEYIDILIECCVQLVLTQCACMYATTLTFLRTLWSRVLLEKLRGSHLVKKFSAFYGIRRFNPASQEPAACSYPKPYQYSPYHRLISWIFILILCSHLRLGLPSGLFPSGFPAKTLYAPLLSPCMLSPFYNPNNI
jgi:hypothetical protein